MNKVMTSVVYRFAILLTILMMVTGCTNGYESVHNIWNISPGYVMEIGKFQTMHIIKSALNGAWWTTVLTDPTTSKFIVVWPMAGENGVAFYVWDAVKINNIKTMADLRALSGFNRAQIGDIEDVSNLVSHLQGKGWSVIDAAAISSATKTALMNALQGAARLDTFFIVPAGVFDNVDEIIYPVEIDT